MYQRFVEFVAVGSDKKTIYINPDHVISVQDVDGGQVELSISDTRSIYVYGTSKGVSFKLSEGA